MADLEQAFFLKDFSGELPEGCSRIYFGAEFCFWRMPSVEQILSAIKLARENFIALTLVTPVLGEDERQRLAEILAEVLPALSNSDEILISDWGTLELVRETRSEIEVVIGRALSGQKRGPRILDLELMPEQEDYFQKGSWHNQEAVTMLQELGIKRVEQDNLLQGLAPLPQGLKSSLHVPYAMVTSSRNCPFRTPGEFGPCNAPCGEVFTLQTDEVETILYQDGNTQFLFNETLPGSPGELRIDRVVVHPRF